MEVGWSKKLEELSFNWKVKEFNNGSWDHKFALLEAYKAIEGHCNVLQRHKVGDVALGSWVDKQQNAYRKKTLKQEQLKQLEELGFNWKVKEECNNDS